MEPEADHRGAGVTPVIDSAVRWSGCGGESDRPGWNGDVPASRDCIDGGDTAGEQCGLDRPGVGQFELGPSVPQRTS